MARRIIDYNGTVVGVGGAYPYGDIKDNPSGTIIDRTSNADLQQFFQKLLAEAGITGNGLADNVTNGYQLTEAMSKVISNHAAQIVISMLGDAYDVTKMYVLHGLDDAFTGGYVLYDGEIWALAGYIGGPCVDAYIVTPLSPVLYTSGVQSLQISCGTSGTGIVDYTDLIFINKWITGTPTFSAAGGGSVSGGTVNYSRYRLTGDTCFYDLFYESFTVTGTVTGVNVLLPFLPDNVFGTPDMYTPAVFIPSGGDPLPAYAYRFNGTPSAIQITKGSNFTSGDSIHLSIAFEVA